MNFDISIVVRNPVSGVPLVYKKTLGRPRQ